MCPYEPAHTEAGMTAYVALLRAVNVGGRNRLPMAELRNALSATLDYIERRLRAQGTARNWRTVQKLGPLLEA
jgi:uncharacterized protein (DUF1697 family)